MSYCEKISKKKRLCFLSSWVSFYLYFEVANVGGEVEAGEGEGKECGDEAGDKEGMLPIERRTFFFFFFWVS